MGFGPLIPRGKVRCRKVCRARFARSSEFVPRTVELLILWKKIESLHATMQPNARQVLLPGDRSLIEGCLACELQLKVLWYG